MSVKALQGFVVAAQFLFQNGTRSRSIFAMDNRLLKKLIDADLPAREGVLLPADSDERLPAQEDAVESILAEKSLHNGKIQFGVLEQFQQMLRIVYNQRQCALVFVKVFADIVPEEVVSDGLCRADLEIGSAVIGKAFPQILFVELCGSSILLQKKRRFRLFQMMIFVGKQFALINFFQAMDLLRDCRLRNVEEIRGFPIIHTVAQSKKGIHPVIEHVSSVDKHILSFDELY